MEAQQLVDRYFESTVGYWDEVYRECDLAGTIYQRRNEETLKWVAQLRLPPDSRIVDVGCGTGKTSIAVARMGFSVCALDRVPAMLEQTASQAAQAMLSAQIVPTLGDACALNFDSETFDLTIALGLLPWLNDAKLAFAEMLRVTKRNGHLILSSDNSHRLNYLLDPLENPLAVPLRRKIANWLRRANCLRNESAIPLRMHSVPQFRQFLREQNAEIVREATIGFGPFTFLRQPIVAARLGRRVHATLQSLADRSTPIVSAMGAHHLVLVRRPQ
jgi:ubiquinone/menaquinone biosynthesis C-methylase UbiE